MSTAWLAAVCAALVVGTRPAAARSRARARLAPVPAPPRLPRRPSVSPRARALTVDLIATALGAGVPLAAALEAAATASPPDAEVCRRAAAALRFGLDPVAAVGSEPSLQAVARCLDRASHHGAAATGLLERLAAELRSEEALSAAERARRAGVRIVAPLVVCFLPAFVLLAVVPVVLGLGSGLAQTWPAQP